MEKAIGKEPGRAVWILLPPGHKDCYLLYESHDSRYVETPVPTLQDAVSPVVGLVFFTVVIGE